MAKKKRHSAAIEWRLLGKLLGYAWPHWKLILFTLLCMAALAASQGAAMFVIRPFIDEGIAESNIPALQATGWYLLALAAIVALSCAAQEYLRRRAVALVVVDIRDAICRALLPQSMSYFEERRSGDFISRITNDVLVTQRALTYVVGDIALQPMNLIAGVLVALGSSWQLTLFFGLGLPLLVIPLRLLGKRIREAGRESLERLADLTTAMQQMFSGIRVVKAFRMEDAEEQEFHRHNMRFFRRLMRGARARALSSGTVMLVRGVTIAALALFSGWLVASALLDITPGKILQLFAAMALISNSIRRLTKCYNNLQEALGGTERIFEIIEQEPHIRDREHAVALDKVREGITFRNVSFAYRDQPVLRDINLQVPAGQTIAIVGRSGEGKSTLVDLIPRFYDVTAGAVEIDGIDVRNMKHESLLAHITMVTQQTFLFNRSVADNIRYGRPEATMEEVQVAACAANVEDFIADLPEGYDTETGEFGVRLSGGQCQRIAIARAILKNADILILDEAMVGLDSESEALVREAIITLMKGRTTFLIAHDFSTVVHADQIVVIKGGRIVESGTHGELMARNGEYRLLHDLQTPAGTAATASENAKG